MRTKTHEKLLMTGGILFALSVIFLYLMDIGYLIHSFLSLNTILDLATIGFLAFCFIKKKYGKLMLWGLSAYVVWGLYNAFVSALPYFGSIPNFLGTLCGGALVYLPFICMILLSLMDVTDNETVAKISKPVTIAAIIIVVIQIISNCFTWIPLLVLSFVDDTYLLYRDIAIPYVLHSLMFHASKIFMILGLSPFFQRKDEKKDGDDPYSYFQVSILTHVLLLIFTGGIWIYIWTYKATKFTNKIDRYSYRNPTTKLLLCAFVPFYYIYWTYKTAQIIEYESKKRGIDCNIATPCLIISFFVGIVPPILMQEAINKYISVTSESSTQEKTVQETPVAERKVKEPVAQVEETEAVTEQEAHKPRKRTAKPKVEEGESETIPAQTEKKAPTRRKKAPAESEEEALLKYKSLLDKGLITQEDYDAKKKQILNL